MDLNFNKGKKFKPGKAYSFDLKLFKPTGNDYPVFNGDVMRELQDKVDSAKTAEGKAKYQAKLDFACSGQWKPVPSVEEETDVHYGGYDVDDPFIDDADPEDERPIPQAYIDSLGGFFICNGTLQVKHGPFDNPNAEARKSEQQALRQAVEMEKRYEKEREFRKKRKLEALASEGHDKAKLRKLAEQVMDSESSDESDSDEGSGSEPELQPLDGRSGSTGPSSSRDANRETEPSDYPKKKRNEISEATKKLIATFMKQTKGAAMLEKKKRLTPEQVMMVIEIEDNMIREKLNTHERSHYIRQIAEHVGMQKQTLYMRLRKARDNPKGGHADENGSSSVVEKPAAKPAPAATTEASDPDIFIIEKPKPQSPTKAVVAEPAKRPELAKPTPAEPTKPTAAASKPAAKINPHCQKSAAMMDDAMNELAMLEAYSAITQKTTPNAPKPDMTAAAAKFKKAVTQATYALLNAHAKKEAGCEPGKMQEDFYEMIRIAHQKHPSISEERILKTADDSFGKDLQQTIADADALVMNGAAKPQKPEASISKPSTSTSTMPTLLPQKPSSSTTTTSTPTKQPSTSQPPTPSKSALPTVNSAQLEVAEKVAKLIGYSSSQQLFSALQDPKRSGPLQMLIKSNPLALQLMQQGLAPSTPSPQKEAEEKMKKLAEKLKKEKEEAEKARKEREERAEKARLEKEEQKRKEKEEKQRQKEAEKARRIEEERQKRIAEQEAQEKLRKQMAEQAAREEEARQKKLAEEKALLEAQKAREAAEKAKREQELREKQLREEEERAMAALMEDLDEEDPERQEAEARAEADKRAKLAEEQRKAVKAAVAIKQESVPTPPAQPASNLDWISSFQESPRHRSNTNSSQQNSQVETKPLIHHEPASPVIQMNSGGSMYSGSPAMQRQNSGHNIAGQAGGSPIKNFQTQSPAYSHTQSPMNYGNLPTSSPMSHTSHNSHPSQHGASPSGAFNFGSPQSSYGQSPQNSQMSQMRMNQMAGGQAVPQPQQNPQQYGGFSPPKQLNSSNSMGFQMAGPQMGQQNMGQIMPNSQSRLQQQQQQQTQMAQPSAYQQQLQQQIQKQLQLQQQQQQQAQQQQELQRQQQVQQQQEMQRQQQLKQQQEFQRQQQLKQQQELQRQQQLKQQQELQRQQQLQQQQQQLMQQQQQLFMQPGYGQQVSQPQQQQLGYSGQMGMTGSNSGMQMNRATPQQNLQQPPAQPYFNNTQSNYQNFNNPPFF